MLENLINPFYPPIEERAPLPAFYLPAAFALLVLGYAIGPGLIRNTAISSLLLLLTLQRPYYTAGSVASDYSFSGVCIIYFLASLDLGNSNPRWIGRTDKPAPKDGSSGVAWRDAKTWPQRLGWAFNLATTNRGIGWDWQVKGVPAHPEPDATRLRFVGKRVLDFARHVALKSLAVYGIGFCQTVQPAVVQTSPWTAHLLGVIENWCGAVWGWNTIGLAYAAGAAITVLLGIYEPWQWPPMLNSVTMAWSVRRIWSVAYHQILRRVLQQPGIRLARLLGFKKGSIPSRYLQLYLAFYISFCIHWWQQYVITRSDKGEFAFFMMQPVAITIEDFVQWVWGSIMNPKRRQNLHWFELLVGYVWTVAAFTFTLTPYVKGMTGTGVVGLGNPGEKAAMTLGRQHGAAYT
ncbi:hypothetical protein F4779DRAFT_260529 [Xylariaceae sp. FL0662B]|nr:hypothetical protein F4779DRAFT_260529 [Xylariaceae sp. FL0662B]